VGLHNRSEYDTDLEGPSSVNETVGTLEVAVREESGRVQVVHALGQVGHEAELERVVQLEALVLQHVLSTPNKAHDRHSIILHVWCLEPVSLCTKSFAKLTN